jgi:hypothetical protein
MSWNKAHDKVLAWVEPETHGNNCIEACAETVNIWDIKMKTRTKQDNAFEVV